jgi:uncharacterized RDD family membrane protein YckC
MTTINITTSQNIDVEYELGSVGDRIVGSIIDYLIIIAYVIIVFSLVGFGNFGSFVNDNGWLLIIILFPIVFYDLLSELLFDGQSAGKKVMGIKVISLSGEQPSFSQYLNRWIFRLLDFTLSSSMLAVIMTAVTERNQRLGDVIAGTVLIKTKTRTALTQTVYQKLPSTYVPSYPEAINLKDSDFQLIKEVVLTVKRTGNSMLAIQAQQKIEQALNIMSRQAEPIVFLQVILSDYYYLTTQSQES